MSYEINGKKIFQLDNPRGIVKTQRRTVQKLQDIISTYNNSVTLKNEIKKNEKYSSGTPIMLLCPMCEGQVNRRTGTKKNRTVQIGCQTFAVPCYKCSVCG